MDTLQLYLIYIYVYFLKNFVTHLFICGQVTDTDTSCYVWQETWEYRAIRDQYLLSICVSDENIFPGQCKIYVGQFAQSNHMFPASVQDKCAGVTPLLWFFANILIFYFFAQLRTTATVTRPTAPSESSLRTSPVEPQGPPAPRL